MEISGTDCALARESVSADLDEELTELDSRRLQAHLRACPDCSAWAEHVTALTAELREAPLETLAGAAFELRPRRTWRVGSALAAAPAAALVASIAVLFGSAQHASPTGPRTTSTPSRPGDINIGPVGQHRHFHAV